MSGYDNNLTGVLFANDKKSKETDPNAKGSAEIGGVEYWVSAWTNIDKHGQKYQKLKFTAKEQRQQEPIGKQPMQEPITEPMADDFSDPIPF